MSIEPQPDTTMDRMFRAVERVRERLARAVACLESARFPHAVAGGHAVAFWVESADLGGVRFTPDIDILMRRSDLATASAILAGLGMVPRQVGPLLLFLDGPDARERDSIHVVFAGEKVRPNHLVPAPDLDETEPGKSFRVVSLPALIRMKLTAWRLKDQVHLLDLIDVGLIDQSTVGTLPPELGGRLQELLDNPEG